jgi:hypothetical protein
VIAPATLVALEFTGRGPSESFDGLLGRAGTRVDPLDALTSHPRSIQEQASWVLSRLTAPPEAVLGHCTAARLAVQLAAATQSVTPPLVVLLDPDPVSPEYLGREFTRLRAAIDAQLGSQPSRGPVPGGLPAMEAELAGLASGLHMAYGGDADAAELAADLLARYVSWLRFLAAGAEAAPVSFPGEIAVICSGGAIPDVTDIVRPARITCWPGCARDGEGLLSSPAARQALQVILRTAGILPAAQASGGRNHQQNKGKVLG